VFYLNFTYLSVSLVYHLEQCNDSVSMIDAGLYHDVIDVAVDLAIYNVLV